MAHMLKIDGWASGMRFSACHMIPGHTKCSRMHGHSYAVHIRIEGAPNNENMIADFGMIKKAVRDICDELDHKFILPKCDPRIGIAEKGENISITIGERSYSLPKEDIKVLDIPSATAEALARYFLDRIALSIDKENIKELEVGLDEGLGQGAWAKNTY